MGLFGVKGPGAGLILGKILLPFINGNLRIMLRGISGLR